MPRLKWQVKLFQLALDSGGRLNVPALMTVGYGKDQQQAVVTVRFGRVCRSAVVMMHTDIRGFFIMVRFLLACMSYINVMSNCVLILRIFI